MKEHDYAEGGWIVVGSISWLVYDYAVSIFKPGGMVAKGNQGGEEVQKSFIDSDLVGSTRDGRECRCFSGGNKLFGR